MIDALSLFDGMSCGRIALKRAGIPVRNYYASEVDKYAIKVAQANWPDTVQIGDVTKVVVADLPFVPDLVIGGSPCQGFSFGGDGKAFEDPRSALFFQYARIVREARALNPNVKFLLENVRMRQHHADVITEILGVPYVVINSALVSAQNRVRYYWANWEITQPEDRGIFLRDIVQTNEDFSDHVVSAAALERSERRNYSKPRISPDKTGTLNTKNNSGQLCLDSGTTFLPLSEKELAYMDRQVADGRSHWDFKHHSDTQNPKAAALVANLAKGVPYNVLIDREGVTYRKLTPIECERLQTVPDNYTAHVSNSQRYRMLGNGWTVDVVAHIFQGLAKELGYDLA